MLGNHINHDPVPIEILSLNFDVGHPISHLPLPLLTGSFFLCCTHVKSLPGTVKDLARDVARSAEVTSIKKFCTGIVVVLVGRQDFTL